ncbi:phosphatidylinositol N-acetylglucosaminyltransferase [Saccharata proteae CBS 121410]|uniref:Phosphatidylinositol N-acetylglucosaminyltransferase n=1 Tax=Saccharata proteae CBS 121410 TaxID=1314787 RepID=A0A9P4HMB7_9PEZI|nr:phosphatidylinositol N-acetylglucosaminyltransferase [Saccharata proteae CBS 121410]
MLSLAPVNPPVLLIERPTPATVSFTVTTRRPTHSLAAKSLLYFTRVIRIGLGVLILALFWAKWRSIVPPVDSPERLEHRLLESRVGIAAAWMAEGIDKLWLLGGGLMGLWAVLRRGYTEESLLVLRGLGIQTSTSSPTYLSTPTTRFIPTATIQDIFIFEAFKGFEVRFYLAIVVEGEEDAVVVFPTLLPKRQILEEVWRGARACLYEPKSRI